MPKIKVDWIKDCEVCNEGLMNAINDEMEKGKKLHTIAKEFEAKAKKANKGMNIITAGAIKGRYRYHVKGKTNWDKMPSESEFERNVKNFLAHLRTATNAARVLNDTKNVSNDDIARTIPLVTRLDIKNAIREITMFHLMWETKVQGVVQLETRPNKGGA